MCKCFKEATGSCCTQTHPGSVACPLILLFSVSILFAANMNQMCINKAWWANKTDGAGLGINPNLFICYAVNKFSLNAVCSQLEQLFNCFICERKLTMVVLLLLLLLLREGGYGVDQRRGQDPDHFLSTKWERRRVELNSSVVSNVFGFIECHWKRCSLPKHAFCYKKEGARERSLKGPTKIFIHHAVNKLEAL